MTCGLVDIGCYIGNWFAPALAFWQTWDLLIVFVAGLVVGGLMGWRMVLAVITLGVGYFLYDRFKRAPEPDYETGESNMHEMHNTPAPKKRRTLQDIFGGR